MMTSPSPVPPLPLPPGVQVPPGAPAWLTYLGYAVALLVLLGTSTVLVRLVEGWLARRKLRADVERAEVDSDEVFTRVAITLVEPLRERLREADREIDTLRVKTRQALTQADQALAEADHAAAEAHRVRRLLQQWHRAIMDPTATIEWLRQLVGPDEPAI